MGKAEAPIAMMDTGVGGVYVLRRARLCMPHERFLFLADLAHAPYGSRSLEEIRSLTLSVARKLADEGAKALFIACNTATAGAIDALREAFDFPIVGMEPAIKPALEAVPEGKIAVLATPATLRLQKFRHLMAERDEDHRVLPLPCPGLSRMIELEGPDSDSVRDYLNEIAHSAQDVTAAVVGCTHYSYLHRQLSQAFGGVPVFDGADGACRQMKKLLASADLLREEGEGGAVLSTNTGLARDQALLERFYAMAEAEG